MLILEVFKKRLVVLNANLEKLEKLRAPPDAPPTGLLRLLFEIHLQIYHYNVTNLNIVANSVNIRKGKRLSSAKPNQLVVLYTRI